MFCYEIYKILLQYQSLVFNLDFVTLLNKKAILIDQKPVNSYFKLVLIKKDICMLAKNLT